MAYSTISEYQARFKIPDKRNCAALKKYSSADNRIWSNDRLKKFNGLRDILTSTDLNQFSSDDLLEEIKHDDAELEKIKDGYNEDLQRLKDLEAGSGFAKSMSNYVPQKRKVEGVEQYESVKKRAEKYEEVIKERDELKQELSKFANIDNLLTKLKIRAEEADKMEKEIAQLKQDLQKCGHGGSGDKIKVEPSRVSSDTQCNQCREYVQELNKSRSMLELRERKCMQMEAKQKYLLERAKVIQCMEAEMLLYKMKYEECECKLLNLRELIVRGEKNERKFRESQCRLKKVESQLQESEQQNEDLIEKIEQLDMDLKERDAYIQCLNQKLKPDCLQKKAIGSAECVCTGKVQSIIKRMSKESSGNSTCKCNIDNCHCAVVSRTCNEPSKEFSKCKCNEENCLCAAVQRSLCTDSKESNFSECNEDLIINESYSSTACFKKESIALSEAGRLKMEISCAEIKHLRQQNEELDKEIQRLKGELNSMSELIEEFEKERASNCSLEYEINELKNKHVEELEKISVTFRSSLCEKLSEIQGMEKKLVEQIDKRCELEKKLSDSSEQLNEMKKYCDETKDLKKSYQSLENCHKERLKELEALKDKCSKSCDEILRQKKIIDDLSKEIMELKNANKKYACEHNMSKEQRHAIKKSVMDLKRLKDEKAYMIKCYEKKIRSLEAENENLKCFRDKCLEGKVDHKHAVVCNDILYKKLANFGIDSFEYDELTELHDRIRCALIKVTKKNSHVDISVDYNKIIEDVCQKYNISTSKELVLDNLPVRDKRDMDACSTVTYPRRLNKFGLNKKRSKSSEVTNKNKVYF